MATEKSTKNKSDSISAEAFVTNHLAERTRLIQFFSVLIDVDRKNKSNERIKSENERTNKNQ